MPAFIAGGAILAGSALSAYGSSRSASSANAASRNATLQNRIDMERQKYGYGNSLFGNLYGKSTGVDPSKDLLLPPDYQANQDKFIASLGGPLYDQFKNANTTSAGEAAGLPGQYAADTNQLLNRSEGYTNDQANRYAAGGQNLLGDFDTRAAGVMGLAKGYGQGREKIIASDAARSLKASNQLAGARLGASGFGNSTAAAASLAGNARANEESKQRALQDLSDSQAGLTTGIASSQLGQRTGLASGLFNAAQGARERGNAQTLGIAGSRAEGLAGQRDVAATRAAGYRMAPINFANQALGGGILNPYGNQQAAFGIPNQSATGSAASTIGNAGAGLGSLLLFRQLQGQNATGGYWGNTGGYTSKPNYDPLLNPGGEG